MYGVSIVERYSRAVIATLLDENDAILRGGKAHPTGDSLLIMTCSNFIVSISASVVRLRPVCSAETVELRERKEADGLAMPHECQKLTTVGRNGNSRPSWRKNGTVCNANAWNVYAAQ